MGLGTTAIADDMTNGEKSRSAERYVQSLKKLLLLDLSITELRIALYFLLPANERGGTNALFLAEIAKALGIDTNQTGIRIRQLSDRKILKRFGEPNSARRRTILNFSEIGQWK